jgi:DNA polymerase III subunit chi
MTQLEFHTGITDVMGYGCRLLRKAYRRGTRVIVCGEAERLSRLDVLLWTFEQLEFIPHLRVRRGESPSAAMQRTPIWLIDTGVAWPPAEVAINLGDEPLNQPERVARVLELVGNEPAAVQAGRARWRHYASQGLMPVLAGAGAVAEGSAQ